MQALACAVGISIGLSLATAHTSSNAEHGPMPVTMARPVAVDAPLLLDAFVFPAIDTGTQPLRWTDPRPTSLCEPGTTVHVNGEPLVSGAPVPAIAFELEWQSNGCRPFGARGPKFNGQIRLMVFREDSGWSAIIEPFDVRDVPTTLSTGPIWRATASDAPPERAEGFVASDWRTEATDRMDPARECNASMGVDADCIFN